MKTCPECGSHNVIMFDSDNDTCEVCNEWFPAVEDVSTIQITCVCDECKASVIAEFDPSAIMMLENNMSVHGVCGKCGKLAIKVMCS